jgi:hypothetical protein
LFLREAADLFIGGGFAIAFSLTFLFFQAECEVRHRLDCELFNR